jgi:hypothetical protein
MSGFKGGKYCARRAGDAKFSRSGVLPALRPGTRRHFCSAARGAARPNFVFGWFVPAKPRPRLRVERERAAGISGEAFRELCYTRARKPSVAQFVKRRAACWPAPSTVCFRFPWSRKRWNRRAGSEKRNREGQRFCHVPRSNVFRLSEIGNAQHGPAPERHFPLGPCLVPFWAGGRRRIDSSPRAKGGGCRCASLRRFPAFGAGIFPGCSTFQSRAARFRRPP